MHGNRVNRSTVSGALIGLELDLRPDPVLSVSWPTLDETNVLTWWIARNAVFSFSEIQLRTGKASENSAATSLGQKYAADASAIDHKLAWQLTNGGWGAVNSSRSAQRERNRMSGNNIGILVIVLQQIQILDGMWCSEIDGKLSTLHLYWCVCVVGGGGLLIPV